MSGIKEMPVGADGLAVGKIGEDEACLHRGRPAAGQDPAKRDQILEGAWRVFERMGFDAASMNDITREAGVSKGTIYVYFTNKEELFEALVDKYRAKFLAGTLEALTSDAPLQEVLTTYGERLARKLTSHMAISGQRVVIGVTERMPEIGQHFYRKGPCQGLKLFADFLAGHAAKGNLKIDDSDLAADQFSSLCQVGMFRRRLFGDMMDEPTDEQIAYVVASAVKMFMKTYGREPGGAA
jgi:AcrR family transcriptional regulator